MYSSSPLERNTEYFEGVSDTHRTSLCETWLTRHCRRHRHRVMWVFSLTFSSSHLLSFYTLTRCRLWWCRQSIWAAAACLHDQSQVDLRWFACAQELCYTKETSNLLSLPFHGNSLSLHAAHHAMPFSSLSLRLPVRPALATWSRRIFPTKGHRTSFQLKRVRLIHEFLWLCGDTDFFPIWFFGYQQTFLNLLRVVCFHSEQLSARELIWNVHYRAHEGRAMASKKKLSLVTCVWRSLEGAIRSELR